jgi:hypothetical protein
MISSNLNFSNRRMKDLFSRNGEPLFSYEEGLRQIAPSGTKTRAKIRQVRR